MNIALTTPDFQWIMPEIAVAVFGLAVLLLSAFRKVRGSSTASGVLTLMGGAVAFYFPCALGREGRPFQRASMWSTISAPFSSAYSSPFFFWWPSSPSTIRRREEIGRGILLAPPVRGPGHDGHGLLEQFHHHLHRPRGHVPLHLHPLRPSEGEPEGGRIVTQVFPPGFFRHGLLPLWHSAGLRLHGDDRHPGMCGRSRSASTRGQRDLSHGHCLAHRGLRLQDRLGPFPHVDAGRVRGCPHIGHRLHGNGRKSRGFRRILKGLLHGLLSAHHASGRPYYGSWPSSPCASETSLPSCRTI